MRRSSAAVVLVLASSVFAACGNSDGDGATATTAGATSSVQAASGTIAPCTVGERAQRTEPPPGEKGPLTFDRFMIKADGKLTVGSDLDRPPMAFVEGGEPTGFEVELVAEVAERMGLVADVQHRPRDELLEALAQGTYDVVVAELPVPDRPPEGLVFSDPYLDAELAVVMADGSAPTRTVGVVGDTVECPGAEVRAVEALDAALTMLDGGELDAVVADFAAAAHALETGERDEFEIVDRLPTGEQYGIPSATITAPVGKAVNTALADMREDGTYDEIFERWFGEPPA